MYANFMKRNFNSYYAPDGKGGYKEAARGECFAYDGESFKGEYPQQWYWDVENSFVIRLERSEHGKKIYNEARAERRRAHKAYLEKNGCVHKDCLKCKGFDEIVNGEIKCESCVKHFTFVSLDEGNEKSDGEKAARLEIEAGADTDPEHQAITNELLRTLNRVLQTFDFDERMLWKFLVSGAKKKVIAAHFGWTLKQLEYRELKLYTKLRSNQELKNFFKK